MNGPNIRWMILRDMPQIYEIENQSFPEPWPQEEFMKVLKTKSCIGFVAEKDDNILGFMIYQCCDNSYELVNLAVGEQHRRQGIAKELVNHLLDKMVKFNKRQLQAAVSERNLNAQLFFKHLGFRASVVRNYYNKDHDAYMFVKNGLTAETNKERDEACQGV